jgi:hypothetical protein
MKAVGSSAQLYTLPGHGNGTVKYAADGIEWRVVHLVSNGFNQEPLSPSLFVQRFVKPSAGTYINIQSLKFLNSVHKGQMNMAKSRTIWRCQMVLNIPAAQ